MKTQQAKDSAFTLLFKQEKYAVQLYELLTGKKINASTIRSVRLQDGLVKPRLYNDVSFLTEDNELLVLIEHQTTLNKTMAFRLLEYYVKLTGKFIKEYKLNKYGTKEIEIPKAEFFIVYNGKKKMEDFPVLDLGDIQVTCNVLNIHFKNLEIDDRHNAVIAYAKFIELVEDKQLFVNDAIDQLLEEGYLPEFFEQKELRDMFSGLPKDVIQDLTL